MWIPHSLCILIEGVGIPRSHGSLIMNETVGPDTEDKVVISTEAPLNGRSPSIMKGRLVCVWCVHPPSREPLSEKRNNCAAWKLLRPAHHLKVIIAANPLVLEETKNIKDHFLGRRARGRNKIWSPSPLKGAKLARERSIDSTAVALMTVGSWKCSSRRVYPFYSNPKLRDQKRLTPGCSAAFLCVLRATRWRGGVETPKAEIEDAPSVWLASLPRAAHNEYSRCAEGRRRNIYVYKNGKIKLARCIIIVIINALWPLPPPPPPQTDGIH